MKEEINSIQENRTWELTKLSHGYRTIDLKWVYEIKKDESNTMIKYKACFVINRYMQQTRIDFESFRSSGAHGVDKLVLNLTTDEGWEVHHIDVKTTFLNMNLRKKCTFGSHKGSLSPEKNTRCCDSGEPSTVGVKLHRHGMRCSTAPCASSGFNRASTSTPSSAGQEVVANSCQGICR
jgi:hypothetical protein